MGPNQLIKSTRCANLPAVPACPTVGENSRYSPTHPKMLPSCMRLECAIAVSAGKTAISWLQFGTANTLDKEWGKRKESITLDFLRIFDCVRSHLHICSFTRKFMLLQKTWPQGSRGYLPHNSKSLFGSWTGFADVSCVLRHCFC